MSETNQWLPTDWEPRVLQVGASSNPTIPVAESAIEPEVQSPWLPAAGAATAWLDAHAVSVCEFEQASLRQRGFILVRQNRGLLGAGTLLAAVATPAALVALHPNRVPTAPRLAAFHSPAVPRSTVSTPHGHYRVTPPRANTRHPHPLKLALEPGAQTRSVRVVSTPTRPVAQPTSTPIAHATPRPVAATPTTRPAHPVRVQTTSAKPNAPAAAPTHTGSSSTTGSSAPASPPPPQNPVQTAVSSGTQTAGQAVQTAQNAVSGVIHKP